MTRQGSEVTKRSRTGETKNSIKETNKIDFIKKNKKKIEVISLLQKLEGISFSNQQKRILMEESNRILVDAVPGSGKTRTLIGKAILELIISEGRSRVLILTHTNEIVKEITERVENLKRDLGLGRIYESKDKSYKPEENLTETVGGIYVKTVSSFLKEVLLDPNGYRLAHGVENRQTILSERLGKDPVVNSEGELDSTLTVRETERAQSLIKRDLEQRKRNLNKDQYFEYMKIRDVMENIEEITNLYSLPEINELSLKVSNKVLKGNEIGAYQIEVLERLNYDYILIDEYQDLDLTVIQTLSNLLKMKPNIKIIFIGDIDQSIFRFSDKQIQNQIKGGSGEETNVKDKISKEFKDILGISMSRNWRSSVNVISAINMINGDNKNIPMRNNTKGKVKFINYSTVKGDNRRQKNINILEVIGIENNSTFIFRHNLELVEIYYYLQKEGYEVNSEIIEGILNNPYLKEIDSLLEYNSEILLNREQSLHIYNNLFRHEYRPNEKNIRFDKDVLDFLKYGDIGILNFRDKRNRDIRDNLVNIEEIVKSITYGKGRSQNLIDELKKEIGEYFYNKKNITLKSVETQVIAEELVKEIPCKGKKQYKVINLYNIHTVKGLEFNTVTVFPFSRIRGKDNLGDIVEETNLLYVAMTRAKDNLNVVVDNRNEVYNPYIRK